MQLARQAISGSVAYELRQFNAVGASFMARVQGVRLPLGHVG